jgi:hypothetical protein
MSTDKWLEKRLRIILVVLESFGWCDDSTKVANFQASQAPAVTKPH